MKRTHLIPLALLSCLPAASALAVTYTWVGGTGDWSDINWNPGPVAGPTAGANDAVIGSGSVALSSTVNYTGFTSVSGATLDLSATLGRLYSSFGWLNQTVTVGSGGVLNIGGWGDGASGTSGGLGQLSFAAGNLVLNGGTVRYSATTADSGNQDRGFTIGASGATLEANGGSNVFTLNQGRNFGITSSSGGTLTLTGANTGSMAMTLGGTGGVVKNGAGTWSLNNGGNTYSGNTVVNGGVLRLFGTNNGFSTVGAGSLTVNSGATVEANSHNTLGLGTGTHLSPLVLNGGTFLADAYNHINSITMTGGTLGVRSGVSQVDGMDMKVRSSVNPSVTTLASASTATISSRLAVNAPTTFTVADGAAATDLSVTGVVSGASALTKNGPGLMSLAAVNTQTGGITVNAGVLEISGQSAGTGGIRGAVTVNSGAELRSTGAGGAVFGYTAGQKIDTFNIIGGLINNSVGANHVWQATVNLTGGELRTNGGVSSNTTGNYFEWGNTAVNTLASASTATISGRIRVRADASPNLTLTVADGAAATDLLVSAAITSASGTTGLIKNGPGLLRLGGDNLYAGNTTINSGVLELAPGARMYNAGFNNSAVVTIEAGGTWRMPDYSYGGVGQLSDYRERRVLNGGSIEVTGNTHSSGQNFTVNAPGGTFAYLPSGQTLTLNGNGNGNIQTNGPLTFNAVGNITVNEVVEGSGSLVKAGAGTLQLNQSNTYTGSTTVGAGTLRLGNQNALGTTAGDTTIQSGATLDLNGAYAGISSTEAFNVQGSGVGGLGAIVNSGAAIMNSGIGSINLTGNTTFGGANRWDIRSGATFNGNGFTLTKAGAFQMAVTSPLNGADIVINEGRITIQNSNALGTGGTTTVNSGATLDYYGAYTVPETLVFNGGTLASENNDTTFSGQITLNANTPVNTLAGGHDITISGPIGGAGGIVKGGSSSLTLSNAANTYSGPTVVNAGTLVVNTGSEQSLGANPGSFNAGQLRLNNGTLEVSGASLNLNDANRGVSIGTAGTGSGTFNVGTGLTLSLGQTLTANTTGTLTKTGAGTFNLTADAQINALVVDAGNYDQMAGETEILTTTTGLEIRSGAQYYLGGGELKTDKINVLSGGTFRWGAGRLKSYSTNGNLGTTDYTGPGYHAIKAGLTTAVTANLDTESGSVLVMHGSPTLYLNNGVRFNNWAVNGNVDLTDLGDTLEFELNPYFLRPFSSAGIGAIETGSLPLLTWTGTFAPGGVFDTVTGINLTQGGGFTAALTPVTDPNDLLVDTWYIEYDTAAQTVWFHFKVSGYVPEPGSFGLLAMGALGLRAFRVLGSKRREVRAT